MKRGSLAYPESPSKASLQEAQAIPAYLQADEFAAPPWISWWYRLFTPRPPAGRAVSLPVRENIRRARLASIILGVQFFGIELPVIPVVQHAPNGPVVLPWLFTCIAMLLCAFYFNKRGMLRVAGILMVMSIEVTMMVKIITVPGGISVFSLPQFDVLIQPILIAVALLSPWSAFGIGGLNILFILFSLLAGPHAPDLTVALHNPAQVGDLFAVPLLAQVITSFFAFLITKNLLDALKRIDQAEQIVALEHMLAESRKEAEQRNLLLEEGVEAIVHAIQGVSAGLATRIQLPQEHMLWSITTQLNTFLERYQKSREADAHLTMTTQAINMLANEIFQADQQQRPMRLNRSNTPLDAVIIAILGTTQSQKGGATQGKRSQPLG